MDYLSENFFPQSKQNFATCVPSIQILETKVPLSVFLYFLTGPSQLQLWVMMMTIIVIMISGSAVD